MKVKSLGGIKDVPLSEVTAANYIVPQGEERHWHVIQEKVEYDRQTGKKISRPVLQKYDTKAYPTTAKYLRDAGFTITVLHDPIAFAKKVAAAKAIEQSKIAAAKAAKAKAEAEALEAAAKKKAAEEREALKKELRKELLAELKKEQNQGNKK